jgi:hypothetical protein
MSSTRAQDQNTCQKYQLMFVRMIDMFGWIDVKSQVLSETMKLQTSFVI